MTVELLDKTRRINRLLQEAHTSKLVFNDICEEIGRILQSDVLVISKKGKVLGVAQNPAVEPLEELNHKVGDRLSDEINHRLLHVLSTNENVNLVMFGFSQETADRYFSIVMPIVISGERLGTVLMYRMDRGYGIEDVILGEYSTTVVGLEMMRSLKEEDAERMHKRQLAKSAIGTLTGAEREAMTHVLEGLNGWEGILVAGKIADRCGITRSVIVNALRKFESAGIFETHSSGMKGTYIRILNESVWDEMGVQEPGVQEPEA